MDRNRESLFGKTNELIFKISKQTVSDRKAAAFIQTQISGNQKVIGQGNHEWNYKKTTSFQFLNHERSLYKNVQLTEHMHSGAFYTYVKRWSLSELL